MNRFPFEIVHHILEYDGRIKYRNGKYINQIAPDDNRYNMLQSMPQIQPYDHIFCMTIYSFDKQCCFEKYETLHLDEKPWIYSNSTSEIGEYSLKKQGVCYILSYDHRRQHHSYYLLQYVCMICIVIAVNSYKNIIMYNMN